MRSKNYLFTFLTISLLMWLNGTSAQLIFSETFSDADGNTEGTDDVGAVFWETTCADCVDGGDFFKVEGGKLKGQDTNGPATWTTGIIDISDCTFIEIEFDLAEEGDLEGCGTGCNSVDWVQFEYRIDGGLWTNPADAYFCAGACAGILVIQSDDIAGGTRVYATGCMEGGSELELRITLQVWAAAEKWILDNIHVVCAEGPEIDAGPDQTICLGTEIILEADNPDGADIAWDHGVIDGSPFTPGLGTEDYIITATDGICTSTDVVIIEVVAPVAIALTPAGPYSESDGIQIMDATPIGGIWSASCGPCIDPISGAFDPATAGPGTWEVCYDAGIAPCDDHECMFVEVTEDCPIDGIITIISPTCAGDNDGSVSITMSGTTGFVTYSITNALGDEVNIGNANEAYELTSGWYYFSVTDGFPCVFLDSIFLPDSPEMELILTVVNPSCYADLTGSASVDTVLFYGGLYEAISYTWIPNPSGIDGVGITNLTDLPEGIYSVSAQDENGCAVTTNFEILRPSNLTIDLLTKTDVNCVGEANGTIGVEVSGGTAPYLFSIDGVSFVASDSFDLLTAGDYSISIVDNNGCEIDTTVSLVELYDLPIVDFTADITMGCVPLVVGFTSLSGVGFLCEWNFGDGYEDTGCGSIMHTFSTAGEFDVTLTMTDANGCSNALTKFNYVETLPLPVANFEFSPTTITILNPAVQFHNYSENAESYSWKFDELGTSFLDNPTFIFPEIVENHAVTLTAINEVGCSDSIIKIIVVIDAFSVFIPNTFTPDGDQFNGEFKPYFNGIDLYDYQLTIFNRWGEIVFQSYNVNYGWNGLYGEQPAENGVYSYHIITKENNSDKKLEYIGHVTLLR